MLKNRIVALLPVKEGIVVQSIGFRRYLPIGKPQICAKYLTSWGIDEIVMIEIDATANAKAPNIELIRSVAHECLVPLTVGGGIRTLEQMRALIQAGADKVALNNAFLTTPTLVSEGAQAFGNQAVVISLDVRDVPGKGKIVFAENGRVSTEKTAVELARHAEGLGAGEILLTSIEQDGAGTGYDLELIKDVCNAVNIPVIAAGGVGHPQHLKDGIAAGASAVAAGNFFNFSEHSVTLAKSWLSKNQQELRFDSVNRYAEHDLDSRGRLQRLSDEKLLSLRFKHVEDEVI